MFVKKAVAVAAIAAGMSLVGTAANAAPAPGVDQVTGHGSSVSFGDAYHQFIKGGAAAGYGAASLVAGAYTGIAQTPQNVMDNYTK